MKATAASTEALPSEWWRARRWRFNAILVAGAALSGLSLLAGAAAFASQLPCFEITGFTVVFGAIAFAIGLSAANLCYGLGSLAERLVQPKNIDRFRGRLFVAGAAFSLLLIFTPVLGNLAVVALGLTQPAACE